MGISYIYRYTQVGTMSERVWQRSQAGHVLPIFLPPVKTENADYAAGME